MLANDLIGTIHSRAVDRACRLLNGPVAVAERLGVSLTQLLKWLNGTDRMPRSAFHALVDLLRSR